MRGSGVPMVLRGELLVGVSVLSCELVVVRGGRVWPCWWCRFYTCLAGTAPRGVRFPSHGIGLVTSGRYGRAAARVPCTAFKVSFIVDILILYIFLSLIDKNKKQL